MRVEVWGPRDTVWCLWEGLGSGSRPVGTALFSSGAIPTTVVPAMFSFLFYFSINQKPASFLLQQGPQPRRRAEAFLEARTFSLPPLPCHPAWQAGERLTRTPCCRALPGPAHPSRAVCAILLPWARSAPRTGCRVLPPWVALLHLPLGGRLWPTSTGAPAHPEASLTLGFSAIPMSPLAGGHCKQVVYIRRGLLQPVASLWDVVCLSDSDAFYKFLHSNFVSPFALLYD